MKKRIALVIVIAMAVTIAFSFIPESTTTAEASPAYTVLGYLDAKVTANYLNVRTGPSINYRVICVLRKARMSKFLVNWGIGTLYTNRLQAV